MSNTLEVLKQIYKPLRVTIKGKATILETMEGKFLVKEKQEKDLNEVFNYLKSRQFINFASIVDNSRSDYNVFEYVDEVNVPVEQKGSDMIDVVSSLHYKTTYYKRVSEDKYKEIYENIADNIAYVENYYNELFNHIDKEIYMAPSHYLLIRNASKIISGLHFAKDNLNEWYEMVKGKNKERVSLIHNNLALDHFLESDKPCLISWDQSKVDTPVLDLVNFYKKEYFNLEFETIFEQYQKKYPLLEEEKKLFFILISIIDVIILEDSEFNNCQRVRKQLDYLYISEDLIRPYYTVEKEEK